MAVPVINYSAQQPLGDPRWAGMLQSMQNGLQLGMMPSNMYEDLEKKKLANEYARIQNQYAPQGMQAGIEATQAGTQGQQLKNQYFPQMTAAEMALMAAQTRRENTIADWGGGVHLPGSAGDVQALEFFKNKFGEDSTQYKTALNAYLVQQQKDITSTKYQQMLTDTASQRFLTPEGRAIMEQANVNAGYTPSGTFWNQPPGLASRAITGAIGPQPIGSYTDVNGQNHGVPSSPGVNQNQQTPITWMNNAPPQTLPGGLQSPASVPGEQQVAPPTNQKEQNLMQEYGDLDIGGKPLKSIVPPADLEELSKIFDLKRLKSITDPKMRERTLYAMNIDKTISQIDPKALAHYSGIAGQAELQMDRVLAGSGMHIPESYKKYMLSQDASVMLAKQMRQFYGDSIQPSVGEAIQALTNPAGWDIPPTLAEERFNNIKNILDMETATLRDSLKDVGIYRKDTKESKKTAPTSNLTLNAEDVKNLEKSGDAKKTFKGIDGRTYRRVNGKFEVVP